MMSCSEGGAMGAGGAGQTFDAPPCDQVRWRMVAKRWVLALAMIAMQAGAACSSAVRPDAGGFDATLEADAAMTVDAPIGRDATTDERADTGTAPDTCHVPPDAESVPMACTESSCAGGERCNPWTGRCQSAALPFPPSGGDIGSACATDSECRSAGGLGADTIGVGVCQSPGAGDWPGGYCRSYCNLCPDTASVWDVTTLGQSNCPQGAVCLPAYYAQGAGYGTCMRGCRVDSDCRTAEGYYCRRTIGGRTFDNGYCAPAHCQSRGCTSSYECFC